MLDFLRLGLKDMRRTGAVAPSSAALGRAMVAGLEDLPSPRRVLEVGPGTGPFTRQILRGLERGDELDIVEVNEEFCEHLEHTLLRPFRHEHPRVRVRLHNAAIEEAALEGPYDLVVCGLPFNNFRITLVRGIFRRMLSLVRDGGEVRYFEYALLRQAKRPLLSVEARAAMRRFEAFSRGLRRKHRGHRQLVLGNFPPAYAIRLAKGARG